MLRGRLPRAPGPARSAPSDRARIRSILLGPLATGAASAWPLDSASPSGPGAGILVGLTRVSSRASISPWAVRSAVISTTRRSIRSGPRTGMGTSRSTSPRYQGDCEIRSPSIFFWSTIRPFRSALRGRRAAGDVDVDREVFVDPRDDVVPLLERAPAAGAGPHRDDVLRLGHLVVEPGDHRHHRLGDRPRDDHDVGLARRAAEDLGAEPGDVEPARRRADHLDGAAGQAEPQGPEARTSSPVVDGVDHPQQLVPGRHQDVLLQFLLEHRVDDRAPFGSGGRRSRHDFRMLKACQ